MQSFKFCYSLTFSFFVLILLFSKNCVSASSVNADPAKCIVWGSGLKSEVVVPARYFTVQLVDTNGKNLTDSIGEKPFTVSVTHKDTKIRVWLRTVDRHDGSYIIQYKLYFSYSSIKIEVKLDMKHLGGSPFLLEGGVYNEKCYCPQNSISDYMETVSCPSSYRQINKDLKPFPKVNMEKAAKEIVERFNLKGAHSLCHYVVKDNQIYRKTHGQHVGFKMFMDAVLLSLTRKVRLPDIEFFVNLGDWPLEKRKVTENPVPIFSWCGSEETRDIIMPTYDVTESTLESMGRVSLDLISVQGAKNPKWGNKSSLAFWRGRDSRRERLNLVQMSKDHPDIIDAKLTNVFFFRDEGQCY